VSEGGARVGRIEPDHLVSMAVLRLREGVAIPPGRPSPDASREMWEIIDAKAVTHHIGAMAKRGNIAKTNRGAPEHRRSDGLRAKSGKDVSPASERIIRETAVRFHKALSRLADR
jgi:hypothetical protein